MLCELTRPATVIISRRAITGNPVKVTLLNFHH
jgi:hypothetical protein